MFNLQPPRHISTLLQPRLELLGHQQRQHAIAHSVEFDPAEPRN